MTAPPCRRARRPRRAPAERRRGVAACLVVLTLAGGAGAADVVDTPVPVAPDAGGTLARPVPIDDVAPVDVPRPAAGAASLPAPGPVVWLAAAALVLLAARTVSRRASRPLPEEVFALLGEAPMGGTHVARVVRFGPKTVLVGVSGSTCTTLAEIEDPHVTAALAAACRGPAPAPAMAPVDLLRTAVARSLAPARRAEAVR